MRSRRPEKKTDAIMQLVIPYIEELAPVDARLLQLAEFLGISCEAFPLETVTDHARYLARALPDQCSCFVVNPQVMKEWVGVNGIPAELVSFLLCRFNHLIVHGLHVEAFDTKLIVALSRGKLQSVEAIAEHYADYVMARDSKHVCGAFSGLSFGPANPTNDHVFRTTGNDPAVQELISISGRPFLAAVKLETTEILFVASENVTNLNAEVGDAPLTDYFSQLVPHAMALRHAAADRCWRPSEAHACVVIDDPLLRRSYGFLNFESLLRLANRHNFHCTIAFIPHNFRRNSPRITSMFRDNAKRLSICFHGSDHTESEFASNDTVLLNTLLQVAEQRMNLHHQITGLRCDRIMVFPQGNFSIEAMRLLKCHDFYAAVNTVAHPAETPVRLTIGELAQPAVLRYGGFPLFIRKPIRKTQSQDIAFNLFFGRPILIVEHHDVFKHPESLGEIAARINSIAPQIRWSNLATAVSNSILTRRVSNGTHHVRAYSGTIVISNTSDSVRRYLVEWDSRDGALVEQVLSNGTPVRDLEITKARLRLSLDLAPSNSRILSLVHRRAHVTASSLGIRWTTQAFLRRRLSEVRDNYLSKNQHVLTAAKALQRCILK